VQGSPRTFVPMTDRLWRAVKQPAPTLALISDMRDGRFVQSGGPMFAIIPAWEAWAEIGGAALAALLLATAVLYALYWIPALLLRRLRPLPGGRLNLSVRALPLVAVLMLVAAAAVFALAGGESIDRLGNVTVWSISICVLTILFAVTSLAGLVQAWRARHWAVRRGVWIHSLLVAATCTATAIYLASWGLIGLRTWS